MIFFSIKMTADANGNVSFCIEHVKPTDGGAYKMVASNSSGEESALCAVAIMRTYSNDIFMLLTPVELDIFRIKPTFIIFWELKEIIVSAES